MQTVAANHTLKNTNLIQTYHLAPDGETRKMATALHGNVGSKLNYYLWNYVEDDELGYVFDSSATYDFKDGLPKREPDVSFISKEKMQMPPDDDITVPPDIAVEVVSKNDKWVEVIRKVRQYQSSGVPLVWIVTPDSHTVNIYRLEKGLRAETLIDDDIIDGGNVLPKFRVPVRKLFPN